MRDIQQLSVTVIDMQQLHWARRDSERKPATMETVRDMQRLHVTGRDSQRQQAAIGDSERHVATQWIRESQ